MMKYSFQRVNSRFMAKAYMYFALSFLIAIGTGILFISLSNLTSENRLYNKTYKELQTTTTVIEPQAMGLSAITYDDYLYLNEKYKDQIDIFYSGNTKLSFMLNQDFVSIDLIFITDDEIKELCDLSFDGGAIIGRSALESLNKIKNKKPIEAGQTPKNGEYIPLDNKASFDGDKLKIEGEEFSFKVIESKYETRVMVYNTDTLWDGTSSGVRLGYTIFLPIEKLQAFKNEFNWEYFMTRIAIKEENPDSNKLWEILDYLGGAHPEYSYRLNDQLARAKDRLGQMTWNASKYRILSLLLIALVSIASSGLFYIIFYRRKRDIAVSIALGSTFKGQAMELLLEITYVVAFGLLLGISGGSMMADILKIEFKFEPQAFLITVLVAIGIILVSAYLSLRSLKDLSPVEILQNE